MHTALKNASLVIVVTLTVTTLMISGCSKSGETSSAGPDPMVISDIDEGAVAVEPFSPIDPKPVVAEPINEEAVTVDTVESVVEASVEPEPIITGDLGLTLPTEESVTPKVAFAPTDMPSLGGLQGTTTLQGPTGLRGPGGPSGLQSPIGTRGPSGPAGSSSGFGLPDDLAPTATASIGEPSPSRPTTSRSITRSPAAKAPTSNSQKSPATATIPETSTIPPSLEKLPAGSTRVAEQGYATVRVFYATDRAEGALPLSAYEVTGNQRLLKSLCICTAVLFVLSAIYWVFKRSRFATLTTVLGTATAAGAVCLVINGHASIEKRGVTYTGDRGLLTRGVCDVTIPDDHQKGTVERPSLLRFEFREDQQKHIVLSSAIELPKDEFQQRLSETVASSVDRDLLVFIHGYNVDFQSAVRRTAQISVDLPFEGVPVCYSWPSQAKLLGYSIDENNAQWTVAHLKEFLLELATESGAQSINVVAHSMGNRALTAAMQQIQLEQSPSSPPMFDRLVLAAPDVDADLFRKDLASPLAQMANHVTLYASSDDQALIASKRVHGYPRAGESGRNLVVMPGIETIDVSGIDLSLLGHSYYGDNESMLRDLYQVVRSRLHASKRGSLIPRQTGNLVYWQLAHQPSQSSQR